MVDIPDPLTETQLEELQALLEERVREVERSLADATADAQPVSLDESIGRLTRMDAIQQQHMASARKQRLEGEAQQLASALGRLRRGDYGECRRCEEDIGYKRLKARPETLLCRECQGALGR